MAAGRIAESREICTALIQTLTVVRQVVVWYKRIDILREKFPYYSHHACDYTVMFNKKKHGMRHFVDLVGLLSLH